MRRRERSKLASEKDRPSPARRINRINDADNCHRRTEDRWTTARQGKRQPQRRLESGSNESRQKCSAFCSAPLSVFQISSVFAGLCDSSYGQNSQTARKASYEVGCGCLRAANSAEWPDTVVR